LPGFFLPFFHTSNNTAIMFKFGRSRAVASALNASKVSNHRNVPKKTPQQALLLMHC
jgi:hypothetical protein